jgi:hypothetical protein
VALLTTATVTNLTATGASIASANVGTAVVTGLTVTGASIASINAGTATISGNLTLNGGTANGVLYLNGSKVATSGTALVFDGTNLGIGTTSPATKLDVNGDVTQRNGSGTIIGNIQNSSGWYDFKASANVNGSQISTAAATPIRFLPNGVEAGRFDSSGNLGIGTSSPYNQLESTKSGGSTIGIANSSSGASILYGKLAFYSTVAAGAYAEYGGQIRSYSGAGIDYGDLQFYTANGAVTAERARITSGGDLLVGITSSSAKISSDGGASSALWGKCSTSATSVSVIWNSATSGDNLFEQFFTDGGPTVRGTIDYNRAGGLTRYNTTSDYRAKDILGPVQNSGATIDALKVYEGQMKGATQSRPMLVAHEAQEHAPYAVTGEKDAVNEDGTPKYQQMDVSALVPLLLAEIQSLRARVAQLESK